MFTNNQVVIGRWSKPDPATVTRASTAFLEGMLEAMEVPLPETIVTDELNARRQSIEQQLAQAGMTMEAYLEDEKQTIEEFEADLERRVRDAVAAQFVLDEIAKAEEIKGQLLDDPRVRNAILTCLLGAVILLWIINLVTSKRR